MPISGIRNLFLPIATNHYQCIYTGVRTSYYEHSNKEYTNKQCLFNVQAKCSKIL